PAAGGPYHYDVLRGLAPDQYVVAASCLGTGANPETCGDSGLVQNATYHYRVKVDEPVSGNVSLPTGDVQAVTTNASTPFIAATALSTTSVSLSAGCMAGYDTYDIYESQTNIAPTSQPATHSIASTTGA